VKRETDIERTLPLAPIERLLRRILTKTGRVSETAVTAMGKVLEDVGLEIAEIAMHLAEHAKRVTITREDINFAYKEWSPTYSRKSSFF
jgi:histone H3/H4